MAGASAASEPPGDVRAAQRGVELPRFAPRHQGRARRRKRGTLDHQHLGRAVARQRGLEVGGADTLQHELARRQVGRRQPGPLAVRRHGDQEGVAAFLEQVVGHHRARRDHFDHGTLHDAAGGLGIFDLLADRDAEAAFDQLADVALDRLHRHAGQRRLGRGAVVARGEGEAQRAGPDVGVVVEHFVEVAHAEQQDGVAVPRLDLAVLLHQRRGDVEAGEGHGRRTTKGSPPTTRAAARATLSAAACVA